MENPVKARAVGIQSILREHRADIFATTIPDAIKYDDAGNNLFRIGRVTGRRNGSYTIPLFRCNIRTNPFADPGRMEDTILFLSQLFCRQDYVSIARDWTDDCGYYEWNVRVVVK